MHELIFFIIGCMLGCIGGVVLMSLLQIGRMYDNNFQGKDGQEIPEMNEEYVNSVSERYIELFEKIASQEFVKADISAIDNRIEQNVLTYLETHFKKII